MFFGNPNILFKQDDILLGELKCNIVL